jgi:hypothetical protein
MVGRRAEECSRSLIDAWLVCAPWANFESRRRDTGIGPQREEQSGCSAVCSRMLAMQDRGSVRVAGRNQAVKRTLVARFSVATVGNEASRPSLVCGNATSAHARIRYAGGQANILQADPCTKGLSGPGRAPGARGATRLPAGGTLPGKSRRAEKLPKCQAVGPGRSNSGERSL